MNGANTRYLFDTYPILYKDANAPLQQSLMAFGFEHGDGWFKLLDELSAKLEMLNNEPACPYTTVAVQVKEKFGTLRFYTYHEAKGEEWPHARLWSDILNDLTDHAETRSGWTCENCGRFGEMRTGGWIRTLCDDCEARRKGEPVPGECAEHDRCKERDKAECEWCMK